MRLPHCRQFLQFVLNESQIVCFVFTVAAVQDAFRLFKGPDGGITVVAILMYFRQHNPERIIIWVVVDVRLKEVH